MLRLAKKISLSTRNIFIQVQETPNPLSLKFLPGRSILPEASRSYDFVSSADASKKSLLATKLLRVSGVKRVFFGEDFVTITKLDDQVDWSLIRPEIFSLISEHLQSGKPVISEQYCEDTVTNEDDEVLMMIKEILESRVRPMVQEDGGDIVFMGFEDGVVKLKMQGSCTGCPSSGVTLKNGIENMLTFYVPEVKQVIEVKDEADDLAERELARFEQTKGIID